MRTEFERRSEGALPPAFDAAIAGIRAKFAAETPKLATRQSSGLVLDALSPVLPELIGGSADLTGSNNTKAKTQKVITADDFSGGYLHYGIREHAMAAAMNGMAAHGGIIPYGGTFLVFTDYCRPSIRLSALMGLRVIYVMTHDSIGLGEDGPTHQPIEHLAALRAIPNLQVFRPADAVETAECWELALRSRHAPSVLALTRQSVPGLRRDPAAGNRSARGGYVLTEAEGKRQATLIATGSEVALALAARERLAARGIAAAVVSLPCWALFDAQPPGYRAEVLGGSAARCGRSGLDLRLGALCRRWRHSDRHDRVRRLGASGGAFPPFRPHPRGGGRSGGAPPVLGRRRQPGRDQDAASVVHYRSR